MPLHIVDHPLVRHKLGILRRDDTPVKEFRDLCSEVCRLLVYEATKDLPTEKVVVQGWAGPVEAERISGKMITAAPILRAGLGMLDGFLDMIPGAKVSVIGLFRDESNLKPVRYYAKLAKDLRSRQAMILDPMLATGGSLIEAVSMLKEAGCAKVKGLFIVAAPEGVERALSAHPDLEIYTAALDRGLNADGYILPGLGDAGDKIFGTK